MKIITQCVLNKKIIFTFIFVLFFLPSMVYAVVIPTDPRFSFLIPIYDQIGVLRAWEKSTGSENVIVAVLDSGIDIDHPDLQDNIWHNTAEHLNGLDDDNNGYIDDLQGWNFLNNTNIISPDVGGTKIGVHHGTVVAGLIGAIGNNDIDAVGVSMKVRIMPIKVMNKEGEGTVEQVIRGVEYAIANGANIINLSFSGPDSSPEFEAVLKKAYDNGVLSVVAAGNDNDETENGDLDFHPKFPVCIDKGKTDIVIGVAAVDEFDQLADFSNYGSCIDISAPGTKIASTVYNDSSLDNYKKTFNGYFSGTSLAAPLVSGAAALLKAMHPEWGPEKLMKVLYTAVDNIDLQNLNFIGKTGYGRLNVDKAVRARIEEVTLGKPAQKNVTTTIDNIQSKIHKSLPIMITPIKGAKGEIRFFNGRDGYISSIHPFGSLETGMRGTASYLYNEDELVAITEFGSAVYIANAKGESIKKFQTGFPAKSKLSLSVGDINADGKKEIAVVSNFSRTVKVYTRDGHLLLTFQGSPERNVRGLHVILADITGDGVDEIITTHTGRARGADIWIYLQDGSLFKSFKVFTGNSLIGNVISAGDLDGDGIAEIAIARQSGYGKVFIFSAKGEKLSAFYPYAKNFNGGVTLAIGDVFGDGKNVLITGAGAGGGPHVRMFDIQGNERGSFFAYDKGFNGGINVSIAK